MCAKMQLGALNRYPKAVLVLLSCVHLLNGHSPTTLRTGRYKQTVDYKLIDTRVTASYTQPSASACISRCTTVTECMGVSWNPDTLECQLSDREIVHGNHVRKRLILQPPWISYGKMDYNAWQTEGDDGRYSMTFPEAKARCSDEGGRLVTTDEILQLRTDGFHFCNCMWLDNGINGLNGFVLQSPNWHCWGSFNAGIIECGLDKASALCTDDL